MARALLLARAGLFLQVLDEIADGGERGLEAPLTPYRPFTGHADLAAAAKHGGRLTGWSDFQAARQLGGAML
ncbi:hypothetical protein AAFN86_25760 [Roseomonas sp. CAU 1739]|uniref:hypothetical protein n=1 Tax=Roseomonas sp. CAU 1739 TaxID=3140364 RepID=UPI00325B5E34